MTRPVYVDRELASAAVGSTLVLRGDEARHAATVRRTGVGEQIDVVNGRGLRATIEVTNIAKNELSGTVLGVTDEPEHALQLTLVQALAKGGRDEQAVETATEFGVDEVIPWQSARTVVRWNDAAKAAKGRARWNATALAAAKQARRSWVPAVAEGVSTKQLCAWIQDEVAGGTRVFVCHETAQTRLIDVLGATSPQPHQPGETGRIGVVVGPEGGITDDELELFTQSGAETVLLGEHVLRSATAGPWAIAVIRALLG